MQTIHIEGLSSDGQTLLFLSWNAYWMLWFYVGSVLPVLVSFTQNELELIEKLFMSFTLDINNYKIYSDIVISVILVI